VGRLRGGLIPRFLADEKIPRSAVQQLRDRGLEVETIGDLGRLGASDLTLVEVAADEGFSILTLDLDFGRIFVEREPAVQIVVLRPDPAIPSEVRLILGRFLSEVSLDSDESEDALIVVGETGYRVRRHDG